MPKAFQALAALGFLLLLAGFAALALAPPGTDLGIFAGTGQDHLGHAAAFFLLTPLAFAAFPRTGAIWILAILLFLAAALEGGQAFTGREVSATDLAANLAGIAAGVYPQFLWHLRGKLLAQPRRGARKASAEPAE